MTEKLTIGEAHGRKLIKPGGSYFFLENYDPFTNTWTGSGYNTEFKDSVFGMMGDSELREYGIEIVPSKEELEKIEALRLSNRIAKAALELGNAISEWLGNPAAR